MPKQKPVYRKFCGLYIKKRKKPFRLQTKIINETVKKRYYIINYWEGKIINMNISDVKQNNCNNIYFYLHKRRVATKREIAYDLELSLPTVTKTLNTLVEQRLINSSSKIVSKTGGRNPVAYSYLPDARVAIGVGIAKHYVKTVVVDLDGNVIESVQKIIEYNRLDEYMKFLGEQVEDIIKLAKLKKKKILGVGIAVPGLIDHEKEYVVDGRVIDNSGMTKEDFVKYIPFKTRLIHDSDAAGFAEIMKLDNPGDIKAVCYFNVSNSVGGSVFINNKSYRGDGLFSCEIGHLNLIPGGKKCYCGNLGCFDPYCTTEALSSHTNGDLALFFDKLEKGDKKLKKVWDTYLEYLVTAITEIRIMFGCKIIIGGEIGAFIDKYMDTLREMADKKSPFGEKSENFLVPCANKRAAIAAGAGLHFVKEFLDSHIGDA